MKMVLILSESERQALKVMSEADLRFPREQVRYILRQELERRGLLPSSDGAAEFTEVQHATAVN